MNLKKNRIERGLTQTQVAVLVGASLTSYQNWERGVTTPTEENQAKLKKVLESK